MELVELPSRAGLEQESNVVNGNEDELNEARRATGVKKKCNLIFCVKVIQVRLTYQ